jgi:ATP-dependent helicase/nuclease subunit B
MSLQFIFGNSGAGKSYYLYQYIVKEAKAHPKERFLVLVPEQFTMQTQKDLVEMTAKESGQAQGGIMNIEVLSFNRLAHRVFEETGYGAKQVLDDEGKNLILRKIAGQYEGELRVLKGNLKKPGYISEVKSVVSEFTQYGIGFEELDAFMETLGEESYLYYKLQDIRKVYEGFEAYLADQYITKEELLDVLSDAVPESALLRDSIVALDGFTGFTPVQNKLLGRLMKVCSRVLVTVEMDEREDPFVYSHPYQLFAISKQMVTALMKTAQEERILVKDPVYLYQKPLPRFKANPPMAFLESELFRYRGRKYEESQNAISLHMARSPKEESEYIASEMRRLVRTGGYRYRDMAVVVSDMETYAVYLEKACGAYEIPVFMDNKKSILLNAFVEYVRSLLAMIEENFSYESVFRFLRTDMAGFSREEVDRMENYVIALGIKGYKKWFSAWIRRTSRMQEEELEALNGLRKRFVQKIDTLTTALKKRKKTVRDITVAIHEFFLQEQIQEQVQRMSEYFQEEGELASAKEYAQVYRIVIELFDKFVELLGDETISLKEYNELLDAGLEEAKVGVIPPSLDQVVIGDMQRTRLNHLKILFFAGANDTFLPGNLGQGGLLSERDREQFAREKLTLSPGVKEKTYIQKFYLYMNLTKPSEKLYLSCAKTSPDGKALRPAYLIQDMRRLFPALQMQEESQNSLQEYELTTENSAAYLARGLRNRRYGLSEEWKELYTWYQCHQTDMWDMGQRKGTGTEQKEACCRTTAERLLEAAFYKREPERLTHAEAAALYGDDARFSVTRLEQYASCAYAHFLSYGLRLSEREQYQFESMDLGNIAHQSMERFARKADESRVDWTEMTEELREKLIEESVEESIRDYGNTVLYSNARNEYTITRIKKLIRRSVWALTKQMEQGDFRPSGYELRFGSGKIDRIDTCEDEDHVYVKVTDYKTGMKNFDITAFYHGLQLQLPVYMNAALELEKQGEKEAVPAGIFYYKMQDPLVEKETDDQKLENRLLKELRLDGVVNADETVLSHMEHNLSGSSNLIPVGRNRDGSLSKNSKALQPEEFQEFLAYAKLEEQDLKQEITDGNAEAAPYRLGNATGCDYCDYRAVCGFDIGLDGYEYRDLERYSREEVLKKIHDRVEAQEETE